VKATFAAATTGACAAGVGTDYASTCSGASTTCSCVTFTGTATGGFGAGVVAGALTLDTPDTTPEGGCTPFFGSIAITPTRTTTAATTMDINGALCNATLPNTDKTIGGGFDLDPATVDFSGTGSIAGTVTAAGAAKLTLIGATAPIVPSPSATASASASPSASPTP
jgi:hypothetical protein